MQQQISKKILLYFFLLVIFGTINNKNLNQFELLRIKEINIVNLNLKNESLFLNDLEFFKKQNIFF